MTERVVARRYVRALFELALEQGVADGVLEDLAAVSRALAGQPSLAARLFDPRADRAARKEAAGKAAAGARRALVRDFAEFVAERGRAEVLAVAHEEFAAMLREQRGEAVAEVVSAAQLDAALRESLAARLAAVTRRRITLHERVDPSLLGGLRVQVGSTLLDGSVRRRIAGMREGLLRVALPKVEDGGAA